MPEELLNPIGYGGKAQKALAPRHSSLRGKTIALLDIGFPNSNVSLIASKRCSKTATAWLQWCVTPNRLPRAWPSRRCGKTCSHAAMEWSKLSAREGRAFRAVRTMLLTLKKTAFPRRTFQPRSSSPPRAFSARTSGFLSTKS